MKNTHFSRKNGEVYNTSEKIKQKNPKSDILDIDFDITSND